MNAMAATTRTERRHGWSGFNYIPAIWFIISPVVLAFSNLRDATWNNVAAGIAIAIVTSLRLAAYEGSGWSWCNALLGIWMILSPFVLGFANNSTLMWNNIIVGAIVAIVAFSNVGMRQSVGADVTTPREGTSGL